VCSATFDGMPDMSDDFNTKISRLVQRKSMSVPSYFSAIMTPIQTTLVRLVGST
jgi:hypothetical protein